MSRKRAFNWLATYRQELRHGQVMLVFTDNRYYVSVLPYTATGIRKSLSHGGHRIVASGNAELSR